MTVSEMPELMDVLAVLQQVQVMHDDEPKWLIEAMNHAIEKGVKKSVRYRKQTVINVQLKFTPGQMNQLKIEAAVNSVEPKPDTLPLVAYTDTKGRLFGEDPAQQKLPLDRTVDMKRNAANDSY